MRIDIPSAVARIEEIVSPLLKEHGRDLVMVQYRMETSGWVLRLFVDRLDGVSISVDELVETSKLVGTTLEVEEAIKTPYRLEVSSPGIERPLVKAADYSRFSGKDAHITLFEDIDGRRNFDGILRGMDGDDILLEDRGVVLRIPIGKVKRANLKYMTGAK